MHFGLLSSLLLVTLIYCHGDSDRDEKPGGSHTYTDTRPSRMGFKPVWDPNGYVFFCLCMGRLGNQLDHFLGGMAFAAGLNRTLVLPPLRTYRNVRFTEWFRFEPIASHQKVVLAEDFMEYLAPTHWPPSKRVGFCWLPPSSTQKDCKMKEGNPFGPFWDGLKVDFVSSVVYDLSYDTRLYQQWMKQYPPAKYPVLAFRGAPASFPVLPEHRELQRYLLFSSHVEDEAYKYIENHFSDQKFIGLHLRNGADWANACKHSVGQRSYMASPQCLEGTDTVVTEDLCFPSDEEILKSTKYIAEKNNIKVVYVATDKNPMISELEAYMKDLKVKVFHADPWLPVIDMAVLVKADFFIGNCVSSFTAFVKRTRDIEGKPTYFWGLN